MSVKKGSLRLAAKMANLAMQYQQDVIGDLRKQNALLLERCAEYERHQLEVFRLQQDLLDRKLERKLAKKKAKESR